MKKLHYVLIIVIVFLNHANAQQRYLDSIFTDIVKTTETFAIKGDEELKMDIYQPKNDEETLRPLLLFVHGGGFAVGKRDNNNYNVFAQKMTSKGYVNATIDYTLTMKGKSFGCNQPAPNKINAFLQAGYDLSRATQYFIQNSERFGIDTSKIIIMGSSAGAETVLHAAYWNAVKKDEDETFLSNEFKYAGVIGMAGAITTLDLITKENAIPTQLFHGTCDNLVPYSSAAHHYCSVESPGFLILHGSYSIYNHLIDLKKQCYLITTCNGGHELAGDPMAINVKEITDFIYRDVLKSEYRQIHIMVESGKEDCPEFKTISPCD